MLGQVAATGFGHVASGLGEVQRRGTLWRTEAGPGGSLKIRSCGNGDLFLQGTSPKAYRAQRDP